MNKLTLICLLALPCAAFAQSFESSTASFASDSASASSALDQLPRPQSPSIPTSDRPRLVQTGSFTESFVYIYAPDQLGANRTIMGYSATPEIDIVPRLGMQGDFETVWVRAIRYPDQGRILMAAGPRFNFSPRHHVNPFAFAEGGEVRLSTSLKPVNWNPIVKAGFGFEYKLNPHFSLQIVPGEYLGQLLDNGTWDHAYTSRVGIKFNLTRRRYPGA